MRIITLVSLVILLVDRIRTNEIKLGELVPNTAEWEQDGVILLLYQINQDATLFKVRVGLRNTNTFWIQSWTQKEFNLTVMDFTLNSQWKYPSRTIGNQTEECQMKIGAGQHLGVYFPSGASMALRLEKVDPKYPLFGSEYIPNPRELSVGENLKFGRIGYPNKLAIEFYIRLDPTTTVTTTTATTTTAATTTTTTAAATATAGMKTTTTTTAAATAAATIENVENSLPTTGSKGTVTEGRINMAERTTKVFLGRKEKLYIFSSVGIFLALFAIVLCCVLYWRKRSSREERGGFREMTNPIYGTNLDHVERNEAQQSSIEAASNNGIYDTIKSGTYCQVDESAIGSPK